MLDGDLSQQGFNGFVTVRQAGVASHVAGRAITGVHDTRAADLVRVLQAWVLRLKDSLP